MSLPYNMIDQENSRSIDIESQKNSENANVARKKNGLQQSQPQPNRRRIPLGTKNLNSGALPPLKRSQSSFNSELNAANVLQRKKITLKAPPMLQKANSSLGFIHHRNSTLDAPKPEAGVPKLDVNDAVAGKLLHRPKDLEVLPSDELTKQASPLIKAPAVPDITSTFSSITRSLHSSFIPDVETESGDPVKGGKTTTLPAFDEALIEKLSEDPSSIETIPEQTFKVHHVPYGLKPFDKDDLDFFSKPGRTAVNEENEYEYEEIHRNEVNLKFKEIDLDDPSNFNFDEQPVEEGDHGEPEELRDIGLTSQELTDLLDY